jgi:hypothetical protein
MKNLLNRSFFILLFAFILVSCTLGPAQTNGNDENSINTMVAQTVAAANATPDVIIVTATPGQAGLPTITPESLATLAPAATNTTAAAATEDTCNQASFKEDVTVPDGSKIFAGSTFIKTWRVQNIGTCTWNAGYTLIPYSGDNLGAPASIALPSSVPPGGTIEISVSLTAPAANGKYRQDFKLRSDTGFQFGTGSSHQYPLYASIEVIHFYVLTLAPTIDFGGIPFFPLEVSVYNFASNYCSATWKNGGGALPCPGTTSDATGFVVRNDSPYLQNGTQYDGPALFTHPQWIDNGTIAGFFPGIDIQNGYKFRTTLGCGQGGNACEALVQLNYSSDGGPTTLLQQWVVKYGDAPIAVDLDLSSLAGHNVKFILAVAAKGTSAQDWVQWVSPRIVK